MDIVEQLRKYQCPENKGCNPVVEYCQCALMDSGADQIERLWEALRNIASKNPFHNQCPPINDVQFYSQMIVEMVGIANAALKEKE